MATMATMATMGSPLDEFHLLLFHLGDQGICASMK
jgi:hypothetical protein